MKKLFKSRLFYFILGAIIFSCGSAFAYSILADDVGFTPTDNTWIVDDTKEALDDLYRMINSKISIEDVFLENYYSMYPASSLSTTNGGVKTNGVINLNVKNSVQYGPYISLSSGCYYVLDHGINLDNKNLTFTVTANNGQIVLARYTTKQIFSTSSYAFYDFKLTTSYSNVEFLVTNNSTDEGTTIKNVFIFKKSSCTN